ncbi:hypothetical protein AMQ84_05790 [Paenibacillus riograndensis]|uniref:Uncharacterized protein n=1 Tax=Paenibacillus riograndensis TaxID=483937 RepID=A0A132U841_9BACL|nr:hypothetical protein AMQ84_05790 [Paenibacillus riograndensis]
MHFIQQILLKFSGKIESIALYTAEGSGNGGFKQQARNQLHKMQQNAVFPKIRSILLHKVQLRSEGSAVTFRERGSHA